MERKLVFTTVYQPLLANLSKTPLRLMDLPVGTILEDVSEQFSPPGEHTPVIHHTNARPYNGYVLSRYIEPYKVYKTGTIATINTGTASISDAAQYIVYKGKVQYNLCGEFCVAYCVGSEGISIEDFLGKLETNVPGLFNRLFYNGQARTTGIDDLKGMIAVYRGKNYIITAQEAFYDVYLKRPLVTPGRTARILRSDRIIIGCTIETQFGRMKPKGTPHWVVVEEVITEARGGLVRIYNPFSNSIEIYSWDEFIASIKTPYGVVVPR